MSNGAIVYVTDKNNEALDIISKHNLYEKQLFLDRVNTKDAQEVENYYTKIKDKVESIDALINNVGIAGPTGKLEELNINDWKETIDININSHFYYTKCAIPLLKKNNGGSIINLSSTAGIFGFPLRTPYAASKWAIIGMTKSLAIELGEFNVRVNAICPGSVSGDRMKRVIEAKAKSLGVTEDSVQKDYESMISLKTFVDKEDIANMSVFLLSKEAHKISGQVMTVDGNTERMN
jgi:NAD(P)-dependent dehydrogenase (short-subunit alcohol dehydrogenase family)